MGIMNATYNLTALANSSGVIDLIEVTNDATGKVLFGFFMVAIFFVLLLGLKRYGFDNAIAASSFACFILSVLLVFAELLNFIYVLGFFILMALTIFYMQMNKNTP